MEKVENSENVLLQGNKKWFSTVKLQSFIPKK